MAEVGNLRIAAAPHAGCTKNMALVLSSLGLMADIYDFGVINLVRPNLVQQFGEMTPREDGLLTAASLVGAIVGQIVFGSVADRCGRRSVFVLTALLVASASLGSSLVTPGGLGVYRTLALCRFVMGVGIGGEYPLSAAMTAENVSARSSGQALATVFAGIALGLLLGPCVIIILSAGLRLSDDMVWRVAFGFGAVLASMTAILRQCYLKETLAYQSAATNTRQEDNGCTIWQSHKASALWMMKRSLVGTAGSWFLYDVVTYGVGLFTTTIFPAQPGLDSAAIVLLIACVSIPGSLLAIILTKRVPMRTMQMTGLGLMLMCFAALASFSDRAGVLKSHRGFCMIVYSMGRAFDQMGPGVATYAVPGQIFPTRIRGTAHGLSAAFGKLGAAVGTFIFPSMLSRHGMQAVMSFMTAMCGCTILWTWMFVPSYGPQTLEEIARYDTGPLDQQAHFAQRVLYMAEDDSLREAVPTLRAATTKAETAH